MNYRLDHPDYVTLTVQIAVRTVVPLTVEISNPKQKDGAEHAPMLLQPRVRDPQVGEGARLPPGLARRQVCGR